MTEAPKVKKSNLEDWQREEIFRCLLLESTGGKLPTVAIKQLAEEYNMSLQTIYRIWHQGRNPGKGKFGSVVSQRKGRCGRNMKYPDLLDRIKSVPAKATRSALSNYALEGQMQAKQLKNLHAAVASAMAVHTIPCSG